MKAFPAPGFRIQLTRFYMQLTRNVHIMKLRILLILCTMLLSSFHSYSQKTVVEKGEYLMRIESSMSENDAIEQAIKMAQINAIENAFGKVVVQGNSSFIQNSTGKITETNSVFSFMADSYVNGEWIETLDQESEIINEKDGSRWVKVIVKGKIRELKNVNYNCEVYTLTCPRLSCKTTDFNEGQGLYLYFRSPQNGYLSVYLDDPYEKVTSRLLPYSRNLTGKTVNFHVNADSVYYLFSREFDYLNDKANIDELELSANNMADQYKIYVLFSTEDFDKPLLDDQTQRLLSNNKVESGYSMPPSLPSEKFQNWQIILRGKNPDIEMQTIMIQVKKL